MKKELEDAFTIIHQIFNFDLKNVVNHEFYFASPFETEGMKQREIYKIYSEQMIQLLHAQHEQEKPDFNTIVVVAKEANATRLLLSFKTELSLYHLVKKIQTEGFMKLTERDKKFKSLPNYLKKCGYSGVKIQMPNVLWATSIRPNQVGFHLFDTCTLNLQITNDNKLDQNLLLCIAKYFNAVLLIIN